ncbi:MAG: HEAT repeat domain-containing protein [Bdellovibrionota bacterium]
MRRPLSIPFLALFSALLNANAVWACSCAFESPEGFVPSTETRGVTAAEPLHLPKNARGVLYYRVSYGSATFADENSIVIQQPSAALRAADFTAVDQTTGKAVEVTLRKVADDTNRREGRYLAITDKKLDKCIPGFPEGCEAERELMNTTGWSAKLLAQGKLQDVSDKQRDVTGLFRVEPKGGFEAGHAYSFTSVGHSARVIIDTEEIDTTVLSQAQLKPEGEMNRRLLSVPAGGSCSTSVVARVQELGVRLSPQAEPYRDAMLFFFDVTGTGLPRQNEMNHRWTYQSSACSGYRYGRSEGQAGSELFYSACGRDWNNRAISPAAEFKITATFGFLQVEDSFRKTEEQTLQFPVIGAEECSPASVVAAATEGADKDKQICEAVQAELTDPAAGLALLKLAADTLKSERPAARRCAATATGRLAYSLQNELVGSFKEVYEHSVIPELGRLIGSDPDTSVRKASGEALRGIAHVGSPLGPHALQFGPALPGLTSALRYTDREVPVTAAEVLSYIGTAGRNAAETLRAILADRSISNYRAPTALAAVDPDSPETRAALIKALTHPDAIERSTAAEALGRLPADEVTVAALTEAVKAGTSNAMEALGNNGSAARSAVPILLKECRTSEYWNVRQSAMMALAQIAPEDPEVRKIIVIHLRPETKFHESSEREFLRSAAIQALGKLGSHAQPAIPDLLGVLKEKPSNAEVYYILDALKKIGADPAAANAALTAYQTKDPTVKEAVKRYLETGSR